MVSVHNCAVAGSNPEKVVFFSHFVSLSNVFPIQVVVILYKL